MNCATSLIKFIVFLFNTLCAVFGLVVAILSWLALKPLNSYPANPVLIVFIVVGSLMFIVSCFGCCGAYQESKCLLWTYFVLIFILFVVQISVTLSTHRYELIEVAEDTITKLWDTEVQHPEGMAYVEQSLECCGLSGPGDYRNKNSTIPDSCYLREDKSKKENLFQKGCSGAAKDFVIHSFEILTTFDWVLAGIQIATLLSASVLIYSFRRNPAIRYETH